MSLALKMRRPTADGGLMELAGYAEVVERLADVWDERHVRTLLVYSATTEGDHE